MVYESRYTRYHRLRAEQYIFTSTIVKKNPGRSAFRQASNGDEADGTFCQYFEHKESSGQLFTQDSSETMPRTSTQPTIANSKDGK